MSHRRLLKEVRPPASAKSEEVPGPKPYFWDPFRVTLRHIRWALFGLPKGYSNHAASRGEVRATRRWMKHRDLPTDIDPVPHFYMSIQPGAGEPCSFVVGPRPTDLCRRPATQRVENHLFGGARPDLPKVKFLTACPEHSA